MDDAKTSLRRSKRARVSTQRAKPTDPQNDASAEPSLSRAEREPSPDDDFEDNAEVRPKSKRTKTADDLRLIEVIRSNVKLIPQAVKLWVEHYERESKSTLYELLTMLFEACGAKYYVKEEDLDEADVDDIVVALVNLAKRGEVEDYQTSKKKEFKSFRDNLLYFLDNLVNECQNGPLFDQVLFDKCMDYIIALSCTPPRIFRQVATSMGLQLVTSFITVAKRLGAQRETFQRQLNAEKKRKKDEGPLMESLKKRLSMTHENITAIEEMMRKIFTGLFVHRYRDIDPNIRMSCIESLGVWILSYPSLFLQDLYLKYLGWTLNDKNAGVRKTSILALQNLYEVDENVPTLGLFTERFSGRMIELADDIDTSVAVCAIGLVKQLLRHQLLTDDELGSLYDLLIDDPPEIRQAIGSLVYDHLIEQKINSSQSGDSDSSSEVHLGRMLQILREFSKDQVLSNYVIDDIWEYMKAMKDWKCIISMLLDESPMIELTDEDGTNLVRLLCASVKKAVGERIVPATDNRKQYHSKAQKELFKNCRDDITIAMMKNYPLLLRKYMADREKIPSLVEIILYMDLGIYSVKRQEQNFKSVLKLIKEAFFKHADKEALRSCVKAINFCSTESKGELQDFVRNQLKEVEDELIAKVKAAMQEVTDGGDEYALLVNSKRLYELQLSRAVPIDTLYEDIAAMLQRFRSMDEEVVGFMLLNMHFHVNWSLNSIINGETIPESSISLLLSKRNTLLEQLEYFLNIVFEAEGGGQLGNQLAARVCTILAEEWYVFRKTTFNSTKLEKLGYSPTTSVLKKFWKLCEQQLNVSDETEDEEANKEDTNREYVEETNRDAVMIVAAKLVTSETVPKEYLGPDIISHLAMHGASISEIVKHFITVLKRKEDGISNIYLEALKRAYHRGLDRSKSDGELWPTKSVQECKELATQLAGTFVGAARQKHRSDILKIVKDGIGYAFSDAPSHLSFLEGAVLQFAFKLPSQDVLDILKDVQRRTENVNTEEDPSGWRPYHTFVDTLQEKYMKNEVVQDVKEGTSVRRRGRPRKQHDIQGKKLFDEQSSSEEEESISGSEPEDAREEVDKHGEEDEEIPLNSLRSASKLRSSRVSREEIGRQAKTGDSKTSGASN